jgi:hypothetical protein
VRALILLALVACSPEIPSGSYLCGPNETCPDGQACDGPTNMCVTASTAAAFACDPMDEHEPDNTPQTGTAIPTLSCVSPPVTEHGCLASGDAGDWYRFTAPTSCVAVEVQIRLAYPTAFEPLAIVLADEAGTQVATDTTCKTTAAGGDDSRCLTMPLTGGQTYTIEVKPVGGDDCDGMCGFNRYTLVVQTATPG